MNGASVATLELGLHVGDLLVGGRGLGALRVERDVGAEVDDDLSAVVPVALHLADLELQQDRGAEEGERDEGHQNHGDHHREVAAEALADLAEDEADSHSSGSGSLRGGGTRGAAPVAPTRTGRDIGGSVRSRCGR